MSAPDVISHNHGARIDTSMHGPGMILIEPGGKPNEFADNYIIDDYCAEEGGRMRQASAEADAPDLLAPAPRIPREVDADSCVGPLLGVLSILLVALVATAAVVLP